MEKTNTQNVEKTYVTPEVEEIKVEPASKTLSTGSDWKEHGDI